MSDAILRRFARDQWVRINGTPRATVLVGSDRAQSLWRAWLNASAVDGTLLDGGLSAMPEAAARAIASPASPIRVLAEDVMRDARPAVNAVCQALASRSKP